MKMIILKRIIFNFFVYKNLLLLHTFVLDISYVTVVVISGVGYGLDTAIREMDNVRSSNVSAGILVFVLGVVSARVTVLYTIFISKRLGWELFGSLSVWSWLVWSWSWSMVWCWWWWASWDSSSGGNESSSDDSLQNILEIKSEYQ